MRANNKVLLSIYSPFVSCLIIYALMVCKIIENFKRLYKKTFYTYTNIKNLNGNLWLYFNVHTKQTSPASKTHSF